jgi:hypothetical protein
MNFGATENLGINSSEYDVWKPNVSVARTATVIAILSSYFPPEKENNVNRPPMLL